MSRDELLGLIVASLEGLCGRVARLEHALTDNVDMALELAELRAAHAVTVTAQADVNDALAARLGGRLVEIGPPPAPRPDLRLVVDNSRPGNDNPPPPQQGP
jgi:hypothetical protein